MEKKIIIENSENKKPYTFRRLNATDIFAMSKLISKIGIKDFGRAFDSSEITNLVSVSEGKKPAENVIKAIGITAVLNVADIILGSLEKCEREIYNLLGRVSTMDEDEIKNLEPAVFAEMIIDFCKKEELGDFISAVSRLTKKA